MSLEGKAVVVTGGASGIGQACAELVAGQGAQVAIVDVDDDKGHAVAAGIQDAGGACTYHHADLTRRDEVAAAVAAVVGGLGRIDVLANVAAIAVHASFMETSDELWRRTVDVCLTGTFVVNQEVARVMVDQGGGRIINFSSTVAAIGGNVLPAYAAAKAGVIALSKSIQLELASKNVVVTVVAPGATDTPLYRRGRTQEYLDRRAQALPFGRPARPAEVAQVVAMLADDVTAHLLAGQTLHTNGGIYMA